MNPFSTLTRSGPQPMQVSGSYLSSYYPTQTSGFDFTSILQMFIPVMMAVMIGMVGGMMRGEKKEENSSQVEEPAVT
ncbi:cell division protein FtsH [Chloroflexota bacterium]